MLRKKMSQKIPRKMIYSDTDSGGNSDSDSGDEKFETYTTIKSYSKQLWDLFALLLSEIVKIDW